MISVGFEPTISAGERSQTYALDSVVTGTGKDVFNFPYLTYWGLPLCLWAKYGQIYIDCGETLP